MGGGGSILTVPILVYVLDYGAKEAIAMSLAVVGTVSLFGAASHWRAGNMNFRIALIFGSVAMVGTYGGARLAVFFSGAAQLLLFAGVMLVAAFFMFRKSGRSSEEAVEEALEASRQKPEKLPFALIAAEGIAVGVLTGLVGVGGGFLIVPALVLLGKVPMKQAVGISLLVIAMKSAAGFVGYMGQIEVDWFFLAGFSAVAVVGILAGTRLVKYIPQQALKRGFAVFLVVMGTVILYKNSDALLGTEDASAAEAASEAPETP